MKRRTFKDDGATNIRNLISYYFQAIETKDFDLAQKIELMLKMIGISKNEIIK
jgi:hypothetical protein